MFYTMKVQLLTDEKQHELLTSTMKKFSEICNYISMIGYNTKTSRNKIKLSEQCYHKVREEYGVPSQFVIRAVGKVVENYKNGSKDQLKFRDNASVVYDSRLLAIKWLERVSITTIEGRIQVPFLVDGYREGIYARRVQGQSDLILQNDTFYLLLLVDLPDVTNVSPIEFVDVQM